MKIGLYLLLGFFSYASQAEEFRIGVVDTGVESTHPLLKDHLLIINEQQQVHLKLSRNLEDEEGHGTHIAGILVNNLPSSLKYKIVPFKNILGGEGADIFCLSDMGTAAIVDFAILHNIKVLNFSQVMMEYSPEAYQALKKAEAKGILIIAAAGNGEKLGAKIPHKLNLTALQEAYQTVKRVEPSTEPMNAYPCAYGLSNILCVGSYKKSGWLFPERTLESNYGRTIVHVMAQGEEIKSSCLKGTFCKMSGSSMATARISALAIKLWIKKPQLTPKELTEELIKHLPVSEELKSFSSSGVYLD